MVREVIITFCWQTVCRVCSSSACVVGCCKEDVQSLEFYVESSFSETEYISCMHLPSGDCYGHLREPFSCIRGERVYLHCPNFAASKLEKRPTSRPSVCASGLDHEVVYCLQSWSPPQPIMSQTRLREGWSGLMLGAGACAVSSCFSPVKHVEHAYAHDGFWQTFTRLVIFGSFVLDA